MTFLEGQDVSQSSGNGWIICHCKCVCDLNNCLASVCNVGEVLVHCSDLCTRESISRAWDVLLSTIFSQTFSELKGRS